jgi:hypothetical protein
MPLFDLDVVGDELVAEIPEPQQHAIDQAAADNQQENPNAAPLEVDLLGVPWDSTLHATDSKTGKGILTAKGSWRKRRGLKGSPSHLNTGPAAAPSEPKEDPTVTEKRTLEQQNRMAGVMAGTMLVRLSTAVGGKEFLPRTITTAGVTYSEEEFLQNAFGDYFVAKGISDIPPGMVLASALCMYYLPRFQEPAVREKGSRFVSWCKGRVEALYFWFKYKRKGKPTPKELKSESATNGIHHPKAPIPPRESHHEL